MLKDHADFVARGTQLFLVEGGEVAAGNMYPA